MSDKSDDKPTDDPKPKDDPQPPAQDDGTDWKAEARKWEQRAKENKDAAAKLAKLEEADKTEVQKLTDKLAAEKDRADKAEQRALRLEVAQDKGLTPAQAKRLAGSTKEELEADADELLETFAPAEPSSEGEPSGTSRRPKEALTPGASTVDDGDDVDIRAVVDAIPRGI